MTMDVYFDYACPFCLRGLAYLQELSEKHPEIKLNFVPVEAHPRPEKYGLHTDLCARGMYVARDMGVDLWTYHTHMYRAAVNDRVNIESAGVLSESMAKILDKQHFFDALQGDAYEEQIKQNNKKAYEELGIWAVPSFRMSDGRKLDAKEGVGVHFQELEAFMKGTRA